MQMSKHTHSSIKKPISHWVIQLCFSLSVALVPALYSANTSAVIVDNLYVADVLVTNESNAQLRAGARAGLLQVLVRVSGSMTVEDSPLIVRALRTPEAYYNEFSYESTETSLLAEGETIEAKRLRLRFEPSAVARLLRDAGLPVWGSNRPGVLLWIAVNDGAGRRILGEADAGVVTTLIDQARQRGVPLIFPIMDLEDAGRISAAEVWGAFLERIESASGRYSPDALLTGRLQQDRGGRWNGRWSFQLGDGWQSVESVDFSSDSLARNMINRLADELAQRFALGSSRGSVTVVVEGVGDVAAYAAVSGYLDQLTPVLSSSIVALKGHVAEFELQTEGQYEQLVEIIELDERLIFLQADQQNQRLFYRLAQ